MSLKYEQFYPGCAIYIKNSAAAVAWRCSHGDFGMIISVSRGVYTVMINRYPHAIKLLRLIDPGAWLHVVE